MKVAVYDKDCWKPLPATTTIGIIIGAILALGVLGIIIYKVRITMKDRAEYKRFLEEKENFSKMQNENPLYNSPVRTYEIPNEYEMQTRRSKQE